MFSELNVARALGGNTKLCVREAGNMGATPRGSNEFTLIMLEKTSELWAFDPASQCRIFNIRFSLKVPSALCREHIATGPDCFD